MGFQLSNIMLRLRDILQNCTIFFGVAGAGVSIVALFGSRKVFPIVAFLSIAFLTSLIAFFALRNTRLAQSVVVPVCLRWPVRIVGIAVWLAAMLYLLLK